MSRRPSVTSSSPDGAPSDKQSWYAISSKYDTGKEVTASNQNAPARYLQHKYSSVPGVEPCARRVAMFGVRERLEPFPDSLQIVSVSAVLVDANKLSHEESVCLSERWAQRWLHFLEPVSAVVPFAKQS